MSSFQSPQRCYNIPHSPISSPLAFDQFDTDQLYTQQLTKVFGQLFYRAKLRNKEILKCSICNYEVQDESEQHYYTPQHLTFLHEIHYQLLRTELKGSGVVCDDALWNLNRARFWLCDCQLDMEQFVDDRIKRSGIFKSLKIVTSHKYKKQLIRLFKFLYKFDKPSIDDQTICFYLQDGDCFVDVDAINYIVKFLKLTFDNTEQYQKLLKKYSYRKETQIQLKSSVKNKLE